MRTKENILKRLTSKKTTLSKFGVRNVGLFSSYSRNKQHQENDIDLLFDFDPEKKTFDNYMAVYDVFENMFKNIKIGIVTKNGLSPYIGQKILKEVEYV